MTIVVSNMRQVVSVDSRSIGKRYAEVKVLNKNTTAGNFEIGLTVDNPPSVVQLVRSNGVAWRHIGSVTQIESNVASFGEAPALATGDLIMLAVNFTNWKFWFGKSGAWVRGGDPGADTGETGTLVPGTYFIGSCAGNDGGAGFDWWVQLNTLSAQFEQVMPSGFSQWGVP